MAGSRGRVAPAPKHLAQTAGWQQHTARQLENGQKHSQKQSFQGQQPNLPGRMNGLQPKQRRMTQVVYSAHDARMKFLEINGIEPEVRPIAGASNRSPLVFLHEGLDSVSLWAPRGQDRPQAVCMATNRAGLRAQPEPVPDLRHPASIGRDRPGRVPCAAVQTRQLRLLAPPGSA